MIYNLKIIYRSKIKNSANKLLKRLEFQDIKLLNKKELSLLKILLADENRAR